MKYSLHKYRELLLQYGFAVTCGFGGFFNFFFPVVFQYFVSWGFLLFCLVLFSLDSLMACCVLLPTILEECSLEIEQKRWISFKIRFNQAS